MENPLNSDTCNEIIFTTFFKSHAKLLRNYMYYKFKNLELAEDVTQEAFIKLWKNCKDVPLAKAKSYIYTIANNTTLNTIAHQKIVLEYEKTNVQMDRSYESPEYLLEEEEFKHKLLTAINQLNENQRVAFLMHRIDGKKYAEIAAELNISIKAVEKRIHLALFELKKEFEHFR